MACSGATPGLPTIMPAMRERGGTSVSNWTQGEESRWGFLHVRELTRTARVGRGDGPVVPLPRKKRDLPTLGFNHRGRKVGFEEWVAETYTDGLLVMQDGAVVYENYFDGMESTDTHLIMSASKSFTGVLCGILVEADLLGTDDLVTAHLPELVGTSWEGCTIQHLLDMRAGTRWDHDADELRLLEVSDYHGRSSTDLPADTEDWIRTIDNQQAHGGDFHYTSLMTDVLAWILERASGERFPELFSRLIWSKLGAEQDADLMVDASGFPLAEGGFCTTLRDFARFGLMCFQSGAYTGGRVAPAKWFERLYVRDRELIEAYANCPEFDPAAPNAFYHDQWWIWDAETRVFQASGMSGQSLLIHHPSRVVVAKLSTFPDGLGQDYFALDGAGLAALCEALS